VVGAALALAGGVTEVALARGAAWTDVAGDGAAGSWREAGDDVEESAGSDGPSRAPIRRGHPTPIANPATAISPTRAQDV